MSHTNRNIIVLAIVCIILLAVSPTLISGQIPDVEYSIDGHTNSLIEQTNGMISVVSEPSGADTFLDGTSTLRYTPCVFGEVSPGRHTILVSMPGYESDSAQVEVFRGKTTIVRFILVPLNSTAQTHGHANSGSHGSSGSGGNIGPESDPGSGGTPSEGSESIPDGSILVTSSQSGAAVFINQLDTALVTPATIEKEPGDFEVSVSLDGYYTPPPKSATVVSGQQTDVDFQLTPLSKTGTIRVTSSQPGAAVFIRQPENGLTIESDTGLATPAIIEEVPGDYEVSVSLDGYHAPPPKSVTVVSGQQTDVDFTLIPIVNTPEFPSLSFPVLAISVFALAVCGIRLRKQ